MMKVAFFNTHRFEKSFYEGSAHEITFFETRLTYKTAELARGFDCVCVFVTDQVDQGVIQKLAQLDIGLIALRSAGFNHVDLTEASKQKIKIVRVPEYSPHAVAEHAVALILSLNRKIYQAVSRVRESNFSLDGLVGFDLVGKTVGIIGTGKIGSVLVKIMNGFGCNVLGFDISPDPSLVEKYGLQYVDLETLFSQSDILSLHVPLTPQTHHLIDGKAFSKMKPNAMLINTSRGGLIDTKALIYALKKNQIGFAGLDVYEEEEGIFFENLSGQVLQDDMLARLISFPNVVLTSHQGFLTQEALQNIAKTTLDNITNFEQGQDLANEVHETVHVKK